MLYIINLLCYESNGNKFDQMANDLYSIGCTVTTNKGITIHLAVLSNSFMTGTNAMTYEVSYSGQTATKLFRV